MTADSRDMSCLVEAASAPEPVQKEKEHELPSRQVMFNIPAASSPSHKDTAAAIQS